MSAACKACGRQRSEIEDTTLDRQADVVAAGFIEAGLCDEEGLPLRAAGVLAGEAIDIMMAVALDVGEAEQADQRQILLHRESCLGGEIFRRYEVPRAA